MVKNIFHSVEVVNLDDIQILDAPVFGTSQKKVDSVESPSGDEWGGSKTEDVLKINDEELKKEADNFREKLEIERKEILDNANIEALSIVDESRTRSQEIIESARLEAESIKGEIETFKINFEQEKETLYNESILKAREEADNILEKSREEGIKTGKDLGYDDGRKEASRLVERLHVIIDRILEKRKEILTSLEGQVIELAILIVRRVVKVLSENQKNVVINNVMQALERLKGRSDIIIRVNLADLGTVTEHTEMFVKQIEGDGKLTLAEDSSVDPGGCIIETDFGEIDARISSQLSEIESRIRDLVPVTLRPGALGDDGKL